MFRLTNKLDAIGRRKFGYRPKSLKLYASSMAKKYQEYASITSMQDRGKAKKHSELFSYGMGPPSWLDDVRGQNMGSTRLHKRLKGLDIDVHISTQEKPRALLKILKNMSFIFFA